MQTVSHWFATATVQVSRAAAANAPGTVHIQVTTNNGTSGTSGADQFTYVASGGVPKIVAQVTAQSYSSPGVLAVTVTFTDSGTGNASSVTLQSQMLRTLTGSGTVHFDSSSPTIPISLGNLAVGNSTTVTFYLDVPTTVKRFVISETGVDQDSGGVSHSFSLGQAVIP